jgi:glycosyltransferase involved in cell wall biosynthesis
MSSVRPKVVLLRGHHVNEWDLQRWELLADRFDVTCLVTRSNEFDTRGLAVPVQPVRTRRDRLPPGRLGRGLAYAIGDRYEELERLLAGADIVHGSELHTWFSAQAAGLRERLGFRLVLTAWETIPAMKAFAWGHEDRYRRQVIEQLDLALPMTERCRRALLLDGVESSRIQLCYPGVDVERFGVTAGGGEPGREHVILSPGRLVWEKGHQDVIRAIAALTRGLLGPAPSVRLVIVGAGPEEKRLRRHAAELGIDARVEFRPSVPYGAMPELYRQASAMVLASLPRPGWEEQFGMVLVEALASGTAILASRSGAIPEVAGDDATLFDPGDWFALAGALLEGPLGRSPAERVSHNPDRVALFSNEAAAERLANAYQTVLAGR